jgi:hypothetical protein
MRAALVLANYTGWGRTEIGTMPVAEFADWIKLLPKPDGT